MGTKTPKYAYVLAILAGVPAFIIASIGASSLGTLLVSIFIIFLLAGGLFGFLWPNESWRWGLWIAGPLVALLGLSVLFAGQLDVFLQKDLPVLLLSITAACLGSFISARYKGKHSAATK